MGKLPPQAIELEESVLGALMIEKDAFMVVSDLLRPAVFYKEQNQYVFEAISKLAQAEEPIDVLSVAEKLKSLGTLAAAGGVTYLSDLTRRVASAAHLRYHAQIIAQKATARDLIHMATEIEELGYDETQDITDLMNKAEQDIFEISQRNQKRDVIPIDEAISQAFERIKKASKNEGNISGIPSGFTDLDKITSGWQKSDMIIIAARPAMGKTAFVLSMAKNIAINYHRPVAIFSLEMSNVQLANRLLMNVCEIEGNKIKNGKLNKEEWKRLETKSRELAAAPIYVDETPGLSVFELKSKVRKLVHEKHVELVIIDYLQLMNAQGMNFGSREQEVSIISRNLKTMAKEMDIPVIALSQLNRGVESRSGVEGKKPQLSDLRESGAIEQDADMVCFIHRPEYYHLYNDEKGTDLRGIGQIIIAKHRNGAVGDINLRFRDKLAKFQNLNEEFDDTELQAPSGTEISIQSSMGGAVSNDANEYESPDGARLGDDIGDPLR
ncbi:MAG: replicative DNA helicase [Paludibacteraceae bacterium]|nr:replicative DNA helicase [Paludibacteraceae bacterium]